MKTKLLVVSLLSAVLGLAQAADGPVAWWTFDERPARDSSSKENDAQAAVSGGPTTVLDRASGARDLIHGHLRRVPGVAGDALLFDGFTTRVVRPAASVPPLTRGWTVEAWIAPQEYSWARTGLVDLDQDGRAGFSFTLNYLGQIGLHAAVNGQWQGCESKEAVPLLKWSHVAGTFDPETGFALYVNGRLVAQKAAKGRLNSAEGLDLFIGASHRKQFPALTEREPSKKFLSNMVFDGLIDEAGIYNRALTADEIKTSFAVNAPGNPQPGDSRMGVIPRSAGTFILTWHDSRADSLPAASTA